LLQINGLTLKHTAYYILFPLFIFINGLCKAQALRQPISAVYLGLGTYSTQQQDVFSFVNNQAALAQTEHASAGVYSERRFMLTETSVYTAAVTVPYEIFLSSIFDSKHTGKLFEFSFG